MKKYALTALGPYRPGNIVLLSKVLYENRCAIGDLNMGVLENVFAVSLVFLAPEDKNYLKNIKEFGRSSGLKLSLKEVTGKFPACKPANYIVTVAGPNRAGLVYRVASGLIKTGMDIVELETKRIEGGERELYIMVFEVYSPVSIGKARERLVLIGKKAGVKIEISPVEI
ncbi:MAG: hypothetical protein HY893_07900 [Deltaproteobacteria bacterium]|nr:hypothetical protein [Deltaproteobacteria bacterium]